MAIKTDLSGTTLTVVIETEVGDLLAQATGARDIHIQILSRARDELRRAIEAEHEDNNAIDAKAAQAVAEAAALKLARPTGSLAQAAADAAKANADAAAADAAK